MSLSGARQAPALFSFPCSTTLVCTSQCGSSLSIPLRVSDEWHRSFDFVFRA
ncbi:hypothetical protein SCLCIDRAFT_1213893 [Scleroderma citrinum Foug A]|uniref:Uncharacterized protein n=1 Tax=Scleroderma citrinum Foug A TaxID=1036808 RepID=A0A0C3AFN7_9AGAM|nr:hypothetical protein SCLCIDRAFT_1213893 [Scleroderma citrinum Foug A]